MRSSGAGQGIIYIVTYACPHCQAPLEVRTGSPTGWFRCPRCGRAGIPPEHKRTPSRSRPRLGDDVLVIGPDSDSRPMTPVGEAPMGLLDEPVRSGASGGRRAGYVVAAAVATALLLVSLLENNLFNAALCGILLLFCLLRLARAPRRG